MEYSRGSRLESGNPPHGPLTAALPITAINSDAGQANRGRELAIGRPGVMEWTPVRIARFVAAAATVVAFTFMGAWTVRRALADYRFR